MAGYSVRAHMETEMIQIAFNNNPRRRGRSRTHRETQAAHITINNKFFCIGFVCNLGFLNRERGSGSVAGAIGTPSGVWAEV